MLATNDALWDWVPGSHDVWLSDGFFRLFGYAPDAVIPTRKSWISLIHPDDRASVGRTIEEFLASDRTVWTGEYRFRKADGTYAWVFDRGYVVRAGGAPRRMIASMMDITARKEAERMKSDFVSFVSHQLRTPLSGMNWMLELANDTPGLPETARDYIAEARESADRLGGLVNDLLDVSRLESGRLALALEPVQLGELTRSVLDESRALVEAKGHQLRLELSEAAPSVLADAQLMRQAVANLMSNAIKYTPAGGTIEVVLAQEDGHLRWQVKDSGIGIPKAAQPRLFEKFYRADNALAMETEGTGLGLNLVRLIIEQFGGTVWCDSEEGHGATFGFAVPAMEAV
jgi:PAS domain S-box-containing protein